MPDSASIPEWEWDASHTPLPLTPSFGSVYPGWMEEALRITFREFGVLPAGIEMRLQRGYTYTRVKPVGLPFVPPAWFVSLALRVWWLHPAVIRRVRTATVRMREGHSAVLLRRWNTEWRPAIVADQARWRWLRLDDLSDAAIADLLARLIEQTGRWVTVHFLLHGAIAIPLFELEQFLQSEPVATEIRVDELVQGSSTASSTPSRALRDVAAHLRGAPTLVDRAELLPPREALALLRSEVAEFAAALDDYLARYGQGIAGRYEFIVPMLQEQPERLVPAILRAVRPDDIGSVTAEQRAMQVEEDVAKRIVGADHRRRFHRLVESARRAYGVRDDNVQVTFLDAFGLCRSYLLDAGSRLAAHGDLSTTDDVFFLSVPETIGALRGQYRATPDLIAERRRRWSEAIANPPPRGFGRRIPLVEFSGLPAPARTANHAIIRYMRGIMAASEAPAESAPDGREVAGIAAVRGRYTGIARVLTSEDEFDRLAPGEVLVCEMTSPAWAPVLPLAGALVTDHGGLLSHPAVIAREFGIPAVVAVRVATRTIPDGALVEVDGDRGVVRVLDHGETAGPSRYTG